jgi:hypothetical protein
MASSSGPQSLKSTSTESSFEGICQSREQTPECCSTPSQKDRNAEERSRFSDKAILNSEKSESHKLFEKAWTLSTEDNNLALYGFRRFKTAHLLNLRLLEEEIDQVDHQIYQAGLKLGIDPAPNDRLGLKHCQKDEHALCPEEVLDEGLILKLRELLRQYGR